MRYYFHLRDSVDRLLDPVGRELGGMQAVRDATLKEVRALIAADVRKGVINLRQRIDVEDAAGQIVYQLDFEDAIEILRGRLDR